ncbi:MAG TPA: hypothetical protein VKP14_01755, partial [Gaiellaceae bacterium]|nr:hypothetical protein [Gaiellaceae bacterium]
ARQPYAYRCRVHFEKGDCAQPTWVRAQAVETLAVERFFDALKARRRREADFGALEQQLIAAEAAHASLIGEQRLLRARDDSRSRERLAAVEAKHAELLDLVRRDRLNRLPDVRTMRRQWPSMTQVERRKALGLAFDAIVVGRGTSKEVLADRVHFIGAGKIPDYFPTRRSPAAITPFNPFNPQIAGKGNMA